MHPLTADRFVPAGGLTWHVQESGTGPVLLLLHGTGASAHSWRGVLPFLSERFRVIAPDLPGHGLSTAPRFAGFTPSAMAASLRDLLNTIGVSPTVVAGHSAGAAVLVRMVLDRYIAPHVIVSINGALLPLPGFPRWLFAPMAKLLARSPLIPRLLARRAADPSAVRRLIEDTGSRLDSAGIRSYQELVQRPGHVGAALSMMANWDLEQLACDLPALRVPLILFVANGDCTILPSEAERVRLLVPSARIVSLGDLGHLAHEEDPRRVSDELLRLSNELQCLPSRTQS